MGLMNVLIVNPSFLLTLLMTNRMQATVVSGPWVFTLESSSYLPAMKHLKNRALREQLYTAYVSRASTGDTDNAQIIRDMLERKREMAHMLVGTYQEYRNPRGYVYTCATIEYYDYDYDYNYNNNNKKTL